jgi:Tfp pilus assembly protein PilF
LSSIPSLAPRQSQRLFGSPEKRNVIVCLLLAVLTLALYNPVNHHPFVNYDDDRYVTENRHVRQGLTVDAMRWAITSTEVANWHPLTWMSHELDYSLFRNNPAGHHFTSVIIHAANVVLLFLLLIWATERFGPSLFIAALFASHPIEVESVAWVAERKNVLCTLFLLLTLWAYAWYAKKPGWERYLAVSALFAAGLASKAMVITLPFVLLLLDYWPLNRVGANDTGHSWTRLALEKLPLFALSAASAIGAMRAQATSGALRTAGEFPFSVRLQNAICAYALYLWKMVWPLKLAPFYPHPGNLLSPWKVAAAAVLLTTITVLVLKYRSARYLPVGWFWFLGTLVPVIGLVQLGQAAMADRYAYMPLIGIFIIIAFSAADWVRKFGWSTQVGIVGSLVIVVLAGLTNRQIGFWQSSQSLWAHTLAVTSNNFVAEDNLGGALILEGKEEEAYPHFMAAARINPRDPMSHSNLGSYLLTHSREKEAIEEFDTAIGLTSDPGLLAQAYANRGAAQRTLGNDEAARESFEHSLAQNPEQFNAWFGLGLIAQKHGNFEEAISDLKRSLIAQPAAEAYFQLGRTYMQINETDQAIGAYQQALKISPGYDPAQQALAALQNRK